MTAFNCVRFRVKPGREEEFLEAHRRVDRSQWPAMRHANIVQTGDGSYCIIGEWNSMEDLAAARPQMIATLDTFRDCLEELEGGIGLTDPVSGPVVLSLK